MIESPCEQIYQDTGARDTELVTTKLCISLFAASINACPTVLTDILMLINAGYRKCRVWRSIKMLTDVLKPSSSQVKYNSP
ncbi:MAG: hypothetical protein IKH65_10385 [Clostridia bacterium]|nr:hypothetical protein [Clostridia bacterium]